MAGYTDSLLNAIFVARIQQQSAVIRPKKLINRKLQL